MIVAIVGIDASGKATQSKFLAQRAGAPPTHKVFSFPNYESKTGKLIKAFFKEDLKIVTKSMSEMAHRDCAIPTSHSQPWVLQALMCANRQEDNASIAPFAYSRTPHCLAVLDRWTICGEVFGSADGVDEAWIRKLNEAVVMPDLWILIDVSVEEGFKRRPERRDYHETRRDFLERARQKYLEIFNRRDPSCYVVVDGHGTVDEVRMRIWDAYMKRKDELDSAREAFLSEYEAKASGLFVPKEDNHTTAKVLHEVLAAFGAGMPTITEKGSLKSSSWRLGWLTDKRLVLHWGDGHTLRLEWSDVR